jgi:hypothetical protein
MSVAMPLHLRVGCRGLDVQRGGVQLLEGLEPPLVAGSGQVRGEPLSDLESGPFVGLVVELDSESRFERLNVVLQSAGDVHDAFEQVAMGDVGEVNVNVEDRAQPNRSFAPTCLNPATFGHHYPT